MSPEHFRDRNAGTGFATEHVVVDAQAVQEEKSSRVLMSRRNIRVVVLAVLALGSAGFLITNGLSRESSPEGRELGQYPEVDPGLSDKAFRSMGKTLDQIEFRAFLASNSRSQTNNNEDLTRAPAPSVNKENPQPQIEHPQINRNDASKSTDRSREPKSTDRSREPQSTDGSREPKSTGGAKFVAIPDNSNPTGGISFDTK